MTISNSYKGKAKEFFDTALLREFREVVNSSNVFSDIPKYKNLWNLMCVLMDRLDSAVHYLNDHINQPNSEEEFVFFMVYASMLRDGIYKFYENIYKVKPKTIDNKKWFAKAHDYSKNLFCNDNCPTDDVFFEYLRALSFAHPYGVDNRSGRVFMDKNEIHLSPWVISHCVLGKEKDDVGLRVYSSNDDGLKDIFVRFYNLKKYLLERYNLINNFIKWGKEEIIKQNNLWMERKIDRTGTPVAILNNICRTLDERFISHYSIDEAIKILNSVFEEEININAVGVLKSKILASINSLCDCVDSLDYEEMEEQLNFLYERPDNLHQHAHYELEKIYDYLRDERGSCLPGSNEEWGLIQACNFYESYAKKYVYIDFKEMSNLQIKTLITASLVLGKETENYNKIKED